MDICTPWTVALHAGTCQTPPPVRTLSIQPYTRGLRPSPLLYRPNPRDVRSRCPPLFPPTPTNRTEKMITKINSTRTHRSRYHDTPATYTVRAPSVSRPLGRCFPFRLSRRVCVSLTKVTQVLGSHLVTSKGGPSPLVSKLLLDFFKYNLRSVSFWFVFSLLCCHYSTHGDFPVRDTNRRRV